MKNLIALGNAGGPDVLPLEASVSPKHGLMAIANATSFADSHFSVPLTTFAQGWVDPSPIQATLDFLFPVVDVPRKFQWYKHGTAEDFYSETDDVRAPGADFKRVHFTGEIVQDQTQNKGLTIFVDLDEVAEIPDYENRFTARLVSRLVRNDLRRGVTLALAAASNDGKTWGNAADPDTDVMNALDTAADAMGFLPNRLAYFGNAWIKRVTSYRSQNVLGYGAAGTLTPAQVAEFLGLDEARILQHRYQSSSSAKSRIGGNVALMFSASANMMANDPSHTKRFVSPVTGGGRVRVYVREVTEKLRAITVEQYSKLVVTSSLGLRKLTIS